MLDPKIFSGRIIALMLAVASCTTPAEDPRPKGDLQSSDKEPGSTAKKSASIQIPLNIKLAKVQGKGTATLGETLSKHDVTLVQFWASWCVGCGEVMVEMSQRTKKDPSLGFASVSIDEDMATARGYFASKPNDVKKAMNFVLLDAGGEKVATSLNISELPYLVVATNDGRVHESFRGHPRPEDLTAVIQKARDQIKQSSNHQKKSIKK
jgi:hypothetical protein